MHEIVSRIIFLLLAKEFKSIETSPGFARLLREIFLSEKSSYLLADFFVKSQHSFDRLCHLTIFL